MYCGMSLGRVGLDFRGLLVPLFEREVLRLFSSSVKVRCRDFLGAKTQHWTLGSMSDILQLPFALSKLDILLSREQVGLFGLPCSPDCMKVAQVA